MKVAIIGTAGRSLPLEFQTKDTMEAMYQHCLSKLQTLPEKPTLISGGAAWADHLAVWLCLREGYSLELFLPCYPSSNGRFQDLGFGDWRQNPGKTANFYHENFSRVLGIDSHSELSTAFASPLTTVTVIPGFHARNRKIAEAPLMLAYGWNDGREEEPQNGGTKYTWDLAGKMNCKRRFVNIRCLIKK